MDPRHLVRHLVSAVESRPECLDLARDRGRGRGMQVEKWILTEMLARLIQVKKQGHVVETEGEHYYPYPLRKGARPEKCDLWWKSGDQEHWLEVKTSVSSGDQRSTLKQIAKDIEKKGRLRSTDTFHQLALVFPIQPADIAEWNRQLNKVCTSQRLRLVDEWVLQPWPDRVLYAVLFSSDLNLIASK